MATAQMDTLLWHIRKLAAGRGASQRTDRHLLEDFCACRDHGAFAALVVRHGPMVLRVCRRVLNHEQDAEDAFQATFLVLAQKAGSIRKREALAEWLHGVAYRTATEAKRKAARRRTHEARLGALLPQLTPSPSWDDVRAVLDEEIQRLPAIFRATFVLCVLEGKSGLEAAAALGVEPGTVSSRLTRARQRLQQRLVRRGIELSALLAALAVAESAGQAGVPALLASATLRFGLSAAAGGTAAGGIPAEVAELAAGVTRAMLLSKAKLTTVILVIMSLVGGGTSVLTHQMLAEKPLTLQATSKRAGLNRLAAQQKNAKPEAAMHEEKSEERIGYTGRVIGPNGQPVSSAKLYVPRASGYRRQPSPSPQLATTGADGRFRFTVPKAQVGQQTTVLAAAAANYGVGWVNIPADGKRENVTIQLVADDVPITGQIVDLEAKPVPGATITVMQIKAAPGEDFGPWLEAAQSKKGLRFQLENRYLPQYVPLPATTDVEGRFRLTGIGRNRLVIAQLDGPTIASQDLCMLTRPGEPITVMEDKGDPEYGRASRLVTYYGARFRHVAAPTKPIVGVVRDKETKQPLAGVTVRSLSLTVGPRFRRGFDLVRSTTDAEGRYRLTGMPKRAGNLIVAIPGSDQPYVVINKEVPDTRGLDPVTVDIELQRGIWIEGKITDKGTGKPVQGTVEYFSLYSNPNLQDYPGFDGTILMGELTVRANKDGFYRIVGLPGPGLAAVWGPGDYLRANEREDQFGTKEASLQTSPYHMSFTSNFAALGRIDPAKGAATAKRDITLDPGWTFTGTVLGPDGQPLAGAQTFGLKVPPWGQGMKTAEFTVSGFNPHRPRDLLFLLPGKGLVGNAQPPKENGGSVTVRMEPGATVTGRLVDEGGKPRAGVDLEITFRPKKERYFGSYHPERTKTDHEGRFRIGTLLPGCEFRLSSGKGVLSLGAAPAFGETRELGDVQLKPQS
jgi:RNA polymerase sigma factor (sigma-70 family)